jgi:hypothetical protein
LDRLVGGDVVWFLGFRGNPPRDAAFSDIFTVGWGIGDRLDTEFAAKIAISTQYANAGVDRGEFPRDRLGFANPLAAIDVKGCQLTVAMFFVTIDFP